MFKIVVTEQRMDKGYQACFEHDTRLWAAGRTEREAIGNLVQTHKDVLGVVIEYK